MRKLTINELKAVKGGNIPGCCYHDADWGSGRGECGLSRADAIANATQRGGGMLWCCDSCELSYAKWVKELADSIFSNGEV